MVRACTITFTQYKYGDDPEAYLATMAKNCDWIMAQLEKCPTSGRVHLQGMAHSKEVSRWGFMKPAHVEKCINPIKSIEYCEKERTKLEGPWEFGTRPTWNIKGQKLKNMELLSMPVHQAIIEDKIRYQDASKFQYAQQIVQLGLKRDQVLCQSEASLGRTLQ